MRKLDHSKLPQGTLAFPVLVCKRVPRVYPPLGSNSLVNSVQPGLYRETLSRRKKKSDTLIRANVRIYCTIIAFANFKIILSIKIKNKIFRVENPFDS